MSRDASPYRPSTPAYCPTPPRSLTPPLLPLVHELPAEKLAKIASSGGTLPKAKSDVNIFQHKAQAQGGAIRAGSKSSENMQTSKAPEPPLLAKVVDQLQKDAALPKEHSDVACKNREQKKPMPHSPENAASPRVSASKIPLETVSKCLSHSISDEGIGVATVPVGKNSQDASPCAPLHAMNSVPAGKNSQDAPPCALLHAVNSVPAEVQLKKDDSVPPDRGAEKTNADPGTSEPVSHHLQRGLTDFYLSYSNPTEGYSEEYEVREIEPESDYVGSSKVEPSAAAQEPKGSANAHESLANSATAVVHNTTTIQQREVSEVSGAEQVSADAKRGMTNFYVSYSNPVEAEADNDPIDAVDEALTVTELDAVKEEPGSAVERREET